MSYKTLKVDSHNHIAHITLCRPEKHNAMNVDFWREMPQLIQQLSDDAEARVIVLSSIGKHFCSGMDVSALNGDALLRGDVELGRKHEDLRRTVLQLQEVFNLLEKARMPVLAAVQGACIGGAVDMISACDSRYCTDDAFFSVEETNIGMVADLGTLQRLPALIPQGVARELVYTGRRLYAEEAKALGLVNTVYSSQQEMLDGVMQIAEQIASHSPLVITGCKEMMNYARDHSVADSLNMASVWQSGMFQRADLIEGFSARAEKRKPHYDSLCAVQPPLSSQSSDE
ncbi:MAG: crotonase/enoyl-CoA hydratase family protein [Spongiibacteraceae bacterium]|nr:crotonase/enoyl-CoA hydratase family protein [Spongiibacteraceae bacterium]